MALSVDAALKLMNESRAVAKEKGTFGEKAIIAIVKSYQEIRGGVILHSYSYPYASDRQGRNYPGNIHLIDGKFEDVRGGANTRDEIDVLYMTSYRIFAIECKARGGTWKVFDYWATQNGREVDKSPITQSEKHARHLYHSIYEYLPDGNENYIIPITVFVDKAKVIDSRSQEQKTYIPVAIANILKKKIKEYDSPLQYALDTEVILKHMLSIGRGQLYR